MSEVDIAFEEGILEEAREIASQMGLTLDEVLGILLRKFNAEKGFFFPVDSKELKELRKQ